MALARAAESALRSLLGPWTERLILGRASLCGELGELQRAGDLGGTSVLSVSTKARNPSESLIWSSKFVTELLPTALELVPELVGVHAAAAEDGVLGELHHLLGDHAPPPS